MIRNLSKCGGLPLGDEQILAHDGMIHKVLREVYIWGSVHISEEDIVHNAKSGL